MCGACNAVDWEDIQTCRLENLEQGACLVACQGNHRAMTRREGTAGGGVLDEGEVLEVGGRAELIVARGIAVVHQYPLVLVNQFEESATLHGHRCLLQVVRGILPLTAIGLSLLGCQSACRHLGNAVGHVVLIDGVIEAVALVVDDIHIDGGSAAIVEIAGLADEVGKVVVGIAVVHLVIGDAAIAGHQREVHHIASVGAVAIVVVGVPDGLRCPHTCHFGPCRARISGGEVDGGVRPVDQVLRAHQHHTAVTVPSQRALHVGHGHIEPAILAAQDMRVAQSAHLADAVGSNHAAIVQRIIRIAIARECIVDVLVVV